MIIVQYFNRVGWPINSTIELADDAAAAIFTAVRDYEAEKHTSLRGDYLVAPVGGDRTLAEVTEMRAGFVLHEKGLPGWQPIYAKYNMDETSTAIPSLTSPHLTGYCADISNNDFLTWLKLPDPTRPGHNIAARYGLVFTLLGANDLRHAQYLPGTATAALDVRSLATTPKKDDTMNLIYISAEGTKGAMYLLFGEFFTEDLPNRDQAVVWAKNLGLDIDNLPPSDYVGRQYVIDKAAANVARVKGVGGTGPADYVSDGDLAAALAKLEADVVAAIPKGVPLTSDQTVAAVKSAFAGNTITLK